jgi:hypothetical protein
MKKLVLLTLLLTHPVFGSDVLWSRFKGTVKAINGKTAMVTIQNAEGDLITVKVDADVILGRGKEEIKLSDLKIDDKLILLFVPKAIVKEADQPAEGETYKSLR